MYKHFPNRPDSLTPEFVEDEYAKQISAFDAAETEESPAAAITAFAGWNALKSYVHSEGARLGYALSKDMRHEENDRRERFFREKVLPKAEDGDAALAQRLLQSKHSAAVADRFGAQLLPTLGTTVEPLDPRNSDDRVKISELSNRYDKALAKGEVKVDGNLVTLQVARGMASSEKPELRKEAFCAHRQWFLDHREELAGIFAEMVEIRDRMGKKLGHDSFVPLGYLGMARTDYGRDEVGKFRESVLEFATPLGEKLLQRQAERLGTEALAPWDVAYDPELTLPTGIAKPIDEQLDRAAKVFSALSPKLAGHFAHMRENGLIDLENRKGKSPGAYCTSFSDEGKVAIFCNSTGDEDDVGTLMHEMGHAFQGWESQAIDAVDLQWPTADACEIHSMGMEYLSQRHMHEFFDEENAAKYKQNRWRSAVTLLCYVCVVDEFQHWIYENPKASSDDRDTRWREIHDHYIRGVNWTGLEEYEHARWYAQLHIFRYPFYYIDYAIAETGAMQLAMIDAKDHDKAMESYLELCRLGGTDSVLGIFKASGMRSPFEADLMRDLMAHAAEQLGL